MKMTQDNLKLALSAFGADEVEDQLPALDRPFQPRGISLRASFGMFRVSIQAGDSLYCKPRAKAKEYESVEAAVWTVKDRLWRFLIESSSHGRRTILVMGANIPTLLEDLKADGFTEVSRELFKKEEGEARDEWMRYKPLCELAGVNADNEELIGCYECEDVAAWIESKDLGHLLGVVAQAAKKEKEARDLEWRRGKHKLRLAGLPGITDKEKDALIAAACEAEELIGISVLDGGQSQEALKGEEDDIAF